MMSNRISPGELQFTNRHGKLCFPHSYTQSECTRSNTCSSLWIQKRTFDEMGRGRVRRTGECPQQRKRNGLSSVGGRASCNDNAMIGTGFGKNGEARFRAPTRIRHITRRCESGDKGFFFCEQGH
uniref:Uncharacterized protein n=1 Tax=Physcomitrium patens TaxID=3218 RepID=A0A2K1J7W5_PHYPA|nr:hypothetical protein PHYPA_020725 [Physcomitrium patens]